MEYHARKRRKIDSHSSNDSSESILSIQDKATVSAKDTSDTDWSSGVEIGNSLQEYEVAELSDPENPLVQGELSSGESDHILQEVKGIAELGAVVAAVIYDSEVDIGLNADISTECPTTPSSTSDADPELPKSDLSDFSFCVQCKKWNTDSNYQYCNKCYTAKKQFYPPRPKNRVRHKRERKHKLLEEKLETKEDVKMTDQTIAPVQTTFKPTTITKLEHSKKRKLLSDSLCCMSLSLNFNKTDMEQELKINNDDEPSQDVVDGISSTSFQSNLIVDPNIPHTKSWPELCIPQSNSSQESGIGSLDYEDWMKPSCSYSVSGDEKQMNKCDDDTLCRLCFMKSINSVFVHGKGACLYSCYSCALKSWARCGCCPFCRSKVSQVLKITNNVKISFVDSVP